MAAVRPFWRESATLLLASKRLPPLQSGQNVLNKVFKPTPEPSAADQKESIRFLLMKRSSQSRFMPDTYVFPGGILDDHDFSKEWVQYLRLNDDSNHFFTKGITGSPIFSRQRDHDFSFLIGEVALRLAAIRETFEECGVLLARPVSETVSTNLTVEDNHPLCCSVHNINEEKLRNEWREKISGDASQFLAMCQEMEVVPDIWSLYEWANWMTPLLRSSRYDTAFFIGCVEEAPQISVNLGEMDTGVWTTSSSMLKASVTKMATLAPPQIYELSRLTRFASMDDLLTFASRRSEQRVSRWMPVVYKCADGILFSLPGDDLYPDDPDLTGERTNGYLLKSESFEDLQQQYPNHHRAFMSDESKVISLYCNLEFIDGHILPLDLHKLDVPQDYWS